MRHIPLLKPTPYARLRCHKALATESFGQFMLVIQDRKKCYDCEAEKSHKRLTSLGLEPRIS